MSADLTRLRELLIKMSLDGATEDGWVTININDAPTIIDTMLAAEPEPGHDPRTIRWMCDVIESYAEDRAWNASEGETTSDGEDVYHGVVGLDEIREFARTFGTKDWHKVVVDKDLDPDCYLSEPEPDPAPIQKPQPDWGRKGTQPTGTLGNPPPPNGRPVATKPTNAPAPYVVTDAMIDAGLAAQDKAHRAYAERVMGWPEDDMERMMKDDTTDVLRDAMTAILTAALEAAERARRTGGQG